MNNTAKEVMGAKVVFRRPSSHLLRMFSGRMRGVVLKLFPKEKLLIYEDRVAVFTRSGEISTYVLRADVRTIHDQEGKIVLQDQAVTAVVR